MAEPSDTTDRTLRLLWRRVLGEPTGSRGPKQRTSVNDVVEAGIAIADADGIDAVSVRRVSEKLGLRGMSLYTYVPGRDELVGLMIDEASGDLPLPGLEGNLRERLETVARFQWDEYRRHPWLLDAEAHRPWIGPNLSDRYEWQLSAVEGVGLSDVDMDLTVASLHGTVTSSARAALLAERERAKSGMSDAEWWKTNAPTLEKVMESTDYPISNRVGTAAGTEYNAVSDLARIFEFALARFLDGIETYVERHGEAPEDS